MDQRATYLLQILETIGSPLMGAITDAGSPDAQSDAQADAQSMAALLGKTVEASIELGNIMEINPAEAQDDTLRVALAGLAGPLVAGQFAKRGQVPESPDIKKITGALQAVLTFSDNFAPTPETIERLKNLEASGQIVDTYQTQIQYMQAFIPVIEAISAFPFGQAEAKLVMDVSDRLVKKSVELREALLPGVDDEAAQKRAELGLLRALTALYSACHKAETQRASNLDEDAGASSPGMDKVWSAFDLRAAILETLAAQMALGRQAVSEKASETPPPAAPPAAPAQEQPAATAAEAPPPVPPVVETPPPAEAPPTTQPPAASVEQPAQAQNPMSMFSKPKAAEDNEAAQPPPAAPAQEQPPAPPAEPPPAETAPPQQPPAQPPAAAPEQTDDQSGSGDQGDGQGGSPMSFFKKGDEE